MFKKNKEAQPEINNKGNNKPEVATTAKKKNAKVHKIKSINSWLMQPILPVLVVMAITYGLLEYLFLSPLEEQRYAEAAQIEATAIEFAVSDYFKSQLQWMSSAVSMAVSDQDAIAAVIKDLHPELQLFKLYDLLEIEQLNPQNDSLSFASLDIIRRTAKGEKNAVEAFKQGDQWLFQIALPVYSTSVLEPGETQSTVNAVLFAVFDFSRLEVTLKKLQERTQGQISVLTQDISKPIIQFGGAAPGFELEIKTAFPNWRVQYVPSQSLILPAERINIWLVMAVSALIMAILIVLVIKKNMRLVQLDLQNVAKMVPKAVESDAKFLNNFNFGEVFSMANALVGQLRELIARQRQRTDKLKDAKISPIESVSLDEDEPLFDDDLFDLDADLGQIPEEVTGAIVQEKKGLDVDVAASIFRAYDIRGIVGETLNPQVVMLLGKSIASEALAQGQNSLCVGYDGRLSSQEFCEALVEGVVSTGMNAIIVGQVPTPVLYFATQHHNTGTGVMITGSHNPANYNGLKVMIAGATLSGDAIQKLYTRIITQNFDEGRGERSEQKVDRAYLDTILNDIAVAAPLKVVIDAGNGVAGGLAPELIEELGCEVIPLYCEVDGNFPNHHPDPGNPENLKALIEAVQANHADIGLAFDGDGDRLGVVTNTGKIIWPDRLLMLFAKDVVSRNPGADIIYDVKCSRRLNALISSYGGRPVMWKTGHSLIKEKMKETGALLAGEMSGHIFFKERWYGFDDALYSAARLLEILGVEDKRSDEVFAEFPEDVSTPEINIPVTDDNKFEIIEKLCARKERFVGGNVSIIDGLRVDFPNGWGLCRASNTTPVLVLRFEADNESALLEIQQKFKAQLKEIEPALNLDF